MPKVFASIFSRNAKSNALVRKLLSGRMIESDDRTSRSQGYFRQFFVPIIYLTHEIPRKPVARLEKCLGANDG